MMRLVETETPAFTAFCADDVLGARILAALRSYANLPGENAQCWVQTDELESITAALSCVDGFGILFAAQAADFEELAAFLKVSPCVKLQYDAAARIPCVRTSPSRLMRFHASARPTVRGVAIEPAEELNEVYDLLVRCDFPGFTKNRGAWLADMALRIRRKTAHSWILRQKACAAATASALSLTDGIAFLGAVGTLPEKRGQGLAGALVEQIAAELQAAGKRVYLCCRKELQGFYESVGFTAAGEWVCGSLR
ncbi:MAG: GNAT family N-acetyltransferase [Oscillospiraceae bacterium]|jgi:GNAT superfamily N-acetyltransferase|nr:GNAT family N-acetyltransferase [Oscillospiraceae bacterium]